MDLIEILFVIFFLLIPLLQGLMRRGRTLPAEEADGAETAGDAGESGWVAEEARPELEPLEPEVGVRRDPAPAADMVPDDLWELLTGERRERGPVAADSEAESRVEPWWSESEEPTEPGDPVVEERKEWGRPSPAEVHGLPPEPVSLEYIGPEAYSLEQPLPSPDVRHARFHERLERRPADQGRSRRRRGSPLTRTLRDPAGVRDAIVLAELLGRPKGLE